MKKAREQQKVVDNFKKLGIVAYDVDSRSWLSNLLGDDFFGVVINVNLDPNPFWLPVDEEPIRQIKDDAFENLTELSELRFLDLQYTEITDFTLERLKALKHLESLTLRKTRVSDAGLENLKGLEQLQELGLQLTKVTDAGLEHIKGLNQLKYLDLSGTHVTATGVAKLQKALPNCKITR